MAKLLDPRQPVRFVPIDQRALPEERQIAYLLRPPGLYDQAALERATIARGGRQHHVIEKLQVLRAGVLEVMDEASEADRQFFASKIDAYIEALVAVGEQAMSGTLDTTTEEGRAESLEAAKQLAAFEEALQPITAIVHDRYDRYAQMVADDTVYPIIRGIEAARMFLVGWENLKVPFVRTERGVPDSALARIPRHHIPQIGREVDRLMRPTEDEAKNSDSPSASPSGRKTSPAANSQPRKRRGKTTSGA